MATLMRRSPFAQQQLNKHVTIFLIFGLLLTTCLMFFLTMCNLSCDQHTYNVDSEVWRKSRAFWKDNLIAQTRELKADLVILIISGPSNIHERDAIRETWLNNVDKTKVFFRFVIGVKSLERKVREKLEQELVHRDVLLLENALESYQELTFKVLQSFLWINQYVNYQYVLKVDDDSFVRVSEVLSELQHKPKSRFYWGFFDGRANVKTEGKWKESNWFLCDKYLPYARGGGYILSSDLVHFIASNYEFFQFYLSEDVSVGTWLAPLKIRRHHDQNFDTEYRSRGCLNSYLIMHKQSVLKIRELYNNLQTLGRLCKTEVVQRASYEYNWSYPPSQCCNRADIKFGPNSAKNMKTAMDIEF